GALALPVTSIGRSEQYQQATKRFVGNHTELPICLRVSSAQLDSGTFATDLIGIVRELNAEPERIFFVLDFGTQGSLSDGAVNEFAELLRERVNELPHLHRWCGLAIALSSFPAKTHLKPTELATFQRTDFLVYKQLVAKSQSLLRTPMFGDYGLDTSPLG